MIRVLSQDQKILIDANTIERRGHCIRAYINMIDINYDSGVSNNGYVIVGWYETEERAIEVFLDIVKNNITSESVCMPVE